MILSHCRGRISGTVHATSKGQREKQEDEVANGFEVIEPGIHDGRFKVIGLKWRRLLFAGSNRWQKTNALMPARPDRSVQQLKIAMCYGSGPLHRDCIDRTAASLEPEGGFPAMRIFKHGWPAWAKETVKAS